MAFAIYSDPSRARLVFLDDDLSAAIAALARNNVLVLPQGFVPTQRLSILADAVTVETSTRVAVDLGPDVTNFRIAGSGSAHVTTSGAVASIFAGDGGLVLSGGAGRDYGHGGAGFDVLDGGAGDDKLYGGAGDDILVTGTGRDYVAGGAGDDLIAVSEGRNTVYGGDGADTILIDCDGAQTLLVYDFDAASGDRLMLAGMERDDLTAFLTQAQIRSASGQAVLTWQGLTVQVFGTDTSVFSAQNFVAVTDDNAPAFVTFADFLASGLDDVVDRVRIGDTLWRLRDGQPPHEDFREQDGSGQWWSPDYLVVVAAGQSNMLGGGGGGDRTIGGGVAAWDWVHGGVIAADYDAAPAGGEGVRSGTSPRENLFFPFASDLSAATGRPVLVIAHPVNGTRIDAWLEDRAGTHWAVLEQDIAHALAAVGQADVDVFLWDQGESDFPMPVADYQARLLSFIAQVQGSDWAGGDMQLLIGELSRLGSNAAQNAALQAVELMSLPNVAFVSSTGLAVTDETGVHFSGAALVDYGHRFFAAWAAAGASALAMNTAPQPVDTTPLTITIAEGDALTLDLSTLFSDAEGDDLWFYANILERGHYLFRDAPGGITLAPGYDDAGTYHLTLYANDYLLDGAGIELTLTVTDRAPGLQVYATRDFATLLDQERDLGTAMAGLAQNRGLEILSQAAIDPAGNLLAQEALTLRGAAGLTGSFTLADGLLRAYLAGAATFDLTGNAADNLIGGNDGANILSGGAGRDRLYGGNGSDLLSGGSEDDKLYGGAGADLLDGGTGSDQGWGGEGADIFVFAHGDGGMVARDFTAGEDLLRIAGFAGIDSLADLCAMGSVVQSADRVLIDIGSDRLMVYGTTAAALTEAMFDFL